MGKRDRIAFPQLYEIKGETDEINKQTIEAVSPHVISLLRHEPVFVIPRGPEQR